MANYKAIAATSKAILGLLEEYCPAAEVNNPEFKLCHAFSNDAPIKEGFSLYLFRVAVNGSLRNMPPRLANDGRRYRPSLPIDLYYLLTAWADEPERQQRLLGWAMRFLEDRVILPGNVINRYLGDADRDTFGAVEVVELILDPLPLADHFNLWDKLKPKMQTSVTYVARMVLLDSDLEWTEGRMVQGREFQAGIKAGVSL